MEIVVWALTHYIDGNHVRELPPSVCTFLYQHQQKVVEESLRAHASHLTGCLDPQLECGICYEQVSVKHFQPSLKDCPMVVCNGCAKHLCRNCARRQSFKCPYCACGVGYAPSQICHQVGIVEGKCPLCDHSHLSLLHMEPHLRLACTGYQCSGCSKKKMTFADLKEHMASCYRGILWVAEQSLSQSIGHDAVIADLTTKTDDLRTELAAARDEMEDLRTASSYGLHAYPHLADDDILDGDTSDETESESLVLPGVVPNGMPTSPAYAPSSPVPSTMVDLCDSD